MFAALTGKSIKVVTSWPYRLTQSGLTDIREIVQLLSVASNTPAMVRAIAWTGALPGINEKSPKIGAIGLCGNRKKAMR